MSVLSRVGGLRSPAHGGTAVAAPAIVGCWSGQTMGEEI